ncbi:MAG: transketolase [Planctomycetes bacterium]|nr:transketolase [Planctomycetota bacterium]
MSPAQDEAAVNTIRCLSMDAVQAANSGHPGTPMALAPLGHVIFSRVRRHDPNHPDWPDRDRFVLSCGHASMLQYALLHLCGYDVSLDDIKNFRQWESRTPGHPEYGHTVGVETTTGPLGQGIGNAVGMAMAERHLAARFNRPGHAIIDHRVWGIASDGDLMEGVASEASSLAGHLGLGKLILFWDDNRITIDGGTDLSFSEDVLKRYEAYGWHTSTVEDGTDLDALEAAAKEAADEVSRPSMIRVRTVIGYPAPNKQDSSSAHGAPLGEEEIAKTKEIMGFPPEPFHVPEEVSALANEVRDRGATLWADWDERFDLYRDAFPADAAALHAAIAGELPSGWDAELPGFAADAKGLATRKASGKVLNALAAQVPNLVGGSCDLAGSNNSWQEDKASYDQREGIPNNVHFGVREHGMGAVMNGMALHGGVIPYGATFLVFSDYMRPSIRLAALMGLKTRYIFSHDSIGLGEDGPTHQPVEHLAALRSIPGLTVLRPGDANETREAWKAAMTCEGPCALVLTRQGVPTLDREAFGPAKGVARGAYVLADAEDGDPEVIFLASGSEVSIAVEAWETLATDGVRARVVSVPSWELFEAQDASYHDEVLPPNVTRRVVVEAGIRQGWERWAGATAAFVTVDRFGASAPWQTLFKKYGITADHVVRASRDILGR